MRRRCASPLVLMALAAASLPAFAGCGSPSAEERRQQRADYVRDAEAACVTMGKALNSSLDGRSFSSLGDYLERSEKAVADGAERLHDLRDTLDDSATSEIKAFDARIDAARDSVEPVIKPVRSSALRPSAKQAETISTLAERARRAFGGLYQAGRAAKLDSCGRGGNRLADNALYTPYRERMNAISEAFVKGRPRGRIIINGNRNHDRAVVVRDLRNEIPTLRRLRRLDPPQKLRRAHGRYLRAVAEQIRLKRRENALFAAPIPNYARISPLIRRINAAVGRANRRGRRVFAAMDQVAPR